MEFGPWDFQEVALTVFAAVIFTIISGFAFVEVIFPRLLAATYPHRAHITAIKDRECLARPGHRGSHNLAFIVLHNGCVATLSLVAGVMGSRQLALLAFALEIGYECADILLMRNNLDSTTIIHHIASPVVIICSCFTNIDVRVLCQLCFCIDASGCVLSACKLWMRFGTTPRVDVYRTLTVSYLLLRIFGAYGNTAMILYGIFKQFGIMMPEWMRAYLLGMMMLNVLNGYYGYIMLERSFLTPQLLSAPALMKWDDDVLAATTSDTVEEKKK